MKHPDFPKSANGFMARILAVLIHNEVFIETYFHRTIQITFPHFGFKSGQRRIKSLAATRGMNMS